MHNICIHTVAPTLALRSMTPEQNERRTAYLIRDMMMLYSLATSFLGKRYKRRDVPHVDPK